MGEPSSPQLARALTLWVGDRLRRGGHQPPAVTDLLYDLRSGEQLLLLLDTEHGAPLPREPGTRAAPLTTLLSHLTRER